MVGEIGHHKHNKIRSTEICDMGYISLHVCNRIAQSIDNRITHDNVFALPQQMRCRSYTLLIHYVVELIQTHYPVYVSIQHYCVASMF